MTTIILFAVAMVIICYGLSWVCHLAADAVTFLVHALTGRISRQKITPKGELKD